MTEMSQRSMRTPLGRVRGLGSAKEGTNHFWEQRLTAIALIPLSIWLAVSIAQVAGAGQPEVAAWLSHPLSGLAMILFLAVGFFHFKLGLQVVIEDYVHTESTKITLLILNTFVCVVLALAGIISVLKLMFGG